MRRDVMLLLVAAVALASVGGTPAAQRAAVLVNGGLDRYQVVAVDDGRPGHRVVAVDPNSADSGVISVIRVPEDKPKKTNKPQEEEEEEAGFFSTALRLPVLAMEGLVNTASSTASTISSAANTVFSLPVRAGQVIVTTLDRAVNRFVNRDNEQELAVGVDVDTKRYQQKQPQKQTHHIILPIVVQQRGARKASSS